MNRKLDCKGWKLVITGHSLGAGTAALIAVKLWGRFPGKPSSSLLRGEEPESMPTVVVLSSSRRTTGANGCGINILPTVFDMLGDTGLCYRDTCMLAADVKCLAFSPPGGLMSKNLSRAVEPFVTSVVVGKDVVPRLSVVNIGRLIDQMVSPVLPKH